MKGYSKYFWFIHFLGDIILTFICFLIRDYVTISFFIMVSLAILFIVLPMATFARTYTKKILSFFK